LSETSTPPADLAPRIISNDPADHPVPHGREEEWRFASIRDIQDFFEEREWGTIATPPQEFVSVVKDPASLLAWEAVDRPSAIAQSNFTSAVVIDIPTERVVDEVIVVDLHGTDVANYGRVDIRVGAFARATIVLRHDLTSDSNVVVVTDIADQADATVLNVMDGPRTTRHLWHWHTTVGRDARFLGLSITLGGAFVRLQPSVRYAGPGGSVEMLGAFLASDGQFQEYRIFVDHNEPHCTSNVIYKGALSGKDAHTVWIGDVLVRREAVGIETYEMNRNLLLDDGPRADSVPNLELETGDVVGAGHASATGRFDDEQLFYLESRGIPESLARQLVVRGFFVDVLDKVADPVLRADILRRIEERIGMEALDEALNELHEAVTA